MTPQNNNTNAKADLDFTLLPVHGPSMRPLIWEGMHCVVIVPQVDEPSIGDILVFRQRRRGGMAHVAHRLVAKEQNAVYVMRGDNCLGCERIVSDDIVGRVAAITRVGGWRPWHAVWREQFDVDDRCQFVYTKLWGWLWPVRRVYYRLRGLCAALVSFLFARLGFAT